MFLVRTFRQTLGSYVTCTGKSRAHGAVLPGWRCMSSSAESRSELPSEANVVIIGGGAAGTSLAYHLAKQGCESVLLLELAELTAGSTWHAAGLVTSFHPMANLKPLHKYSLDLFSQLEKETGQEIGLHCPGSIRFATTEERAEEMRYQVSRNRCKGNPARLMTAAEIAHHCPLLQTDTIKLGLYTFDGHLDPYSMTQAYAKGARRYGATMLQNTRVTGLRQESAGDWLLSTSRGDVKAAVVVNAAGFHARDVGIMAGYKLPLVAVHHQYLVTSSIPEVQKLSREMPILRYMEASSYIRMERDGLLIGVYEAPEKMKLQEDWMRKTVPTDFSKQLFEPDLERCESYHGMVMDIIPCLKSAQIQSIVNGPITYTPDGLPMVGPHTLPNMWLAVGFGFGIIHSGGIGKYLADYIMYGEPPFELSELDPARFKESWVTDDYTLAKVRETYGMANHPSYPNDERFAGRPTSRVSTALPQQQARGASCMPHAGWEQPAWFAGEGNTPEFKPAFRRTNWYDAAIKESQVVMKTAGIIDLTPFGKFIVSGTQAGNLLSKATANSLPKEGRCVVTHALTPRGTILAELTISRTSAADTYMVVTGSGSEIHDLRWLQQKARQWGYGKVILTNVTEDFGCLSVAGPRAKDVLREASNDFPDVFPYFGLKKVNIAGISVDALHLSYTGEDGWELYHPREHTGHLYSALLQAGQPYGLDDFGTHALNILRQEKGFRGWGTEMNVDTTMAAAGMMSFVDWNKGVFEGRDALVRQRQTMPESLLVQVSLHSPKLDPIGDESVWCNGGLVGNTTSGSHSPALGKSLAFCYLPPFLTVPGTQVEVEILSELLTAEVLARPPLDTHNMRQRKKKRQS